MRLIHTLAAALLLFLSSCAGLPTPSGNPEVTVSKSQRSSFAARFTNEMLNKNAIIAEQGADFIVYDFVNPAEGLSIALTGEAVSGRVRLSSIELGDTVRVVGTRVSRHRGAFGNTRDVPNFLTADRQQVQDWMNAALAK